MIINPSGLHFVFFLYCIYLYGLFIKNINKNALEKPTYSLKKLECSNLNTVHIV
jgi:hypothetical protein